jgi:hypothetical protein
MEEMNARLLKAAFNGTYSYNAFLSLYRISIYLSIYIYIYIYIYILARYNRKDRL